MRICIDRFAALSRGFIGIALAVCLLASLSCSQFKWDGKDRDGADGGEKPPPLDRDLTDFEKPKLPKDCGDYESSTSVFRPSSIFLGGKDKNPLSQGDNCILKAMDESLKPVCDEEKELKNLAEQYAGDEKAMEEIEEHLAHIEDTKYDFADFFYDIADEMDKIADEGEEWVDDTFTDKIPNSLLHIFLTKELGAYGKLVARRAHRLCGSSLKEKRD